jgi:putative membrane protein
MSPAAQAVLSSWSFPAWITALNLFVALIYFRGWIALHRVMPQRFGRGRLAAFFSGVAILEAALASPIDTFDSFLLTDHMMQHMLLMMIVPPLVLLGDPAIALLHGFPRRLTHTVLGPILKWQLARRVGRWLTYAPVSLFAMSVVMIGWHLPAPYELALRSPNWHEVEHASFLIASFLFWWPVVGPWPSRPQVNPWIIPVYLLLADFVNTGVSAFLTFSDRVFYPSYLSAPRLAGISARSDQAAAGVSMWVVGSLAFLIPAVVITVNLLSPAPRPVRRKNRPATVESRLLSVSLLVLAVLLPLAVVAHGLLTPDTIDMDADTVRMHGVSGPFEITVFTRPDPVPFDRVELAVLVQDRNTHDIVLNAVTKIEFQPAEGVSTESIARLASHALATNQLLAGASVDLPKAGAWTLCVSIDGPEGTGSVEAKLPVVTSSPPG